MQNIHAFRTARLPRPAHRAVFLSLGFFGGILLALALPLGAAETPASLRPIDLRCEFRKDPLGLDAAQPRLSWVLEPTARKAARGLRQSAWQILVAGSLQSLQENLGDLWDSGKTNSEPSALVRYGGRTLLSNQECFWKVRVWDQDGKPSPWSAPGRWTMGLLNRSDWLGNWIGLDEPEANPTTNLLGAAQWIWFPEGHPDQSAPAGTRWFRRAFVLPADRPVKQARLYFTADNTGECFVNGERAGSASDFHTATELDLTRHLHPGRNLLAAAVGNSGASPNPAGFIALLRVDFASGEPLLLVTDAEWRTAQTETAHWQSPTFDDTGWTAAQKLGPPGMAPWGTIGAPEDRRLPARLFRRDFTVDKKLRRATAFLSGLGLSELYFNGEKVGDHVLSPGLTDYTKRAFYVTYDVTRQLRKGANAVGVLLGNGRFYAPRSRVPTGTVSYGFPKLRFQLRLEFTDESWDDVVSDAAWNVSTEGPIQANNEYDGEFYDARREMPGWSAPGFDDSHWQRAQLVLPPGGQMAAETIDPIRVTETLPPIGLTQPKPGVWIFDLGQNLVGWCRLRVAGPRGTVVSLRHAETLKPDGTLYLDNIRSAKVTDTYILKGKGTEVYEPRFTYHGFRYVELTGFPGRPTLATLEGRVVHDDLENAGDFSCSNPLLNRLYRNLRWGVRGNYRSIPTDCPQRDERQGWLGDRSAESKGESYLFHTAALYGKWLQDMADAQKDNGSVPDVCPAYWPFYSDNVTWPSSTIIIPGMLLDQYADDAVLASHYDSAKKWMLFMEGFLRDNLLDRDSYGDWCVPPEEQHLIHSQDPRRKTDKTLLASAYFYYDACLMERYATRLGLRADARHFATLAAAIKTAFNQRFFKADQGQYDNGSQTSCVLPLAFGLVPEEQRGRVFERLVRKITDECHGHLGTGLVGGQWLLRVLTENGRPDLAYTIAAQKSYPSWGYMVEKNATTIWELWNGDTADPAMNSGNHVMLVGDLAIWLYENLAGLKPDPAQPGFKHLLMRPEPVGDLEFVQASHRSPHGLMTSAWRRDSPHRFQWEITLPPNTTATLFIPAADPVQVTEQGLPAKTAPGVKFLRTESDRAVVEIGSGNYRFESRLR